MANAMPTVRSATAPSSAARMVPPVMVSSAACHSGRPARVTRMSVP
jgi:hypothetical protein